MMKDKAMLDKVFDAVLYEALKEVESEPNPDLPEEPDIELSEAHKNKMKKIFDREKRKIRTKGIYRSARYAAAGAAALVIVSGVTVMSVSALRVRFLNFVFNIQRTNTEITAGENPDSGEYDTDSLSIGYIPDGFSLEERNTSGNMVYLRFGNADDDIEITVNSSEGITSVNTEAANCEEIVINGIKSFFSKTENENILTMCYNEKIVLIKSTISEEKIVEIAQSLKIK